MLRFNQTAFDRASAKEFSFGGQGTGQSAFGNIVKGTVLKKYTIYFNIFLLF